MMIGFLSNKVAALVSQFYSEDSKKRYDHIIQRIKDTLQDNDVAMLIIREGHGIQFPPDIEVFSISPPALNDIRRWLRERQEKSDIDFEEKTEPESKEENRK
jgi:CHAT domain-containing protein